MKLRIVFATALGALLGSVLLLSGCDDATESPKPDQAPSKGSQQEGSAGADAPEPTAADEKLSDKAEDSFYAIAMKPSGSYVVGKEAKVETVLEARGGYHCNDEYPHKFKLAAAPEGVTYPEPIAKNIELGEKKSVLSIPFTPTTAGKKQISGTFYFSVCNDKTCKIEKKKLALEVDVGES
jgi:hypothetical protein